MILTFNENRPACRLQETGNQIKQRALSGSAWAKHGNHFTLSRGKGETHWQMLVKPGDINQF
jgi:hypothetical protein